MESVESTTGELRREMEVAAETLRHTADAASTTERRAEKTRGINRTVERLTD